MQTIAPVKNADREMFMDILRGFAILGIFIANLNFLSLYNSEQVSVGYHYAFDSQMTFLQAMFIEGKFYSIFSLLFGWGMALQMQKVKQPGLNSTVLVKRRLWGMLLFGLLHLFILWTGDIVAFYAMLGFLLLLFRNMPDRKLLFWGFFLVLSPIPIYFLKMNFLWLNAPAGILFETGKYVNEHLNHVSANGPGKALRNTGSWIDIWKMNISGGFFRYAYLFFVSRISKVLGMFLIGYYVGRNGNYKKILQNRNLLLRIAVSGFIIGLPANYFLAHYMQHEDDYFDLKMNGFYQTVAYALGVVPLAMAYASSLALVYQSGAGKKILRLLQPVGKMAFSNYLLHSLISILVFYGVGFGFGGQLGPTAWTIFALAVFSFQIFFSYMWLKTFNFGPIEWVWRSLTYRQWQPMRKRPDSMQHDA